jgi:hypothetical protein
MCNQSVGLIASVVEKMGISTVCISLLREITEKVKPPRALFVPFRMGYPLGEPHNARAQHQVISSALSMLSSARSLPVLQALT